MIQRFFKKNLMAALLFMGFLFIFSFLNFIKTYSPLMDYIADSMEKKNSLRDTIEGIETTINENVYGRYKFIDGYGYLQKVLLKNEESNFEIVKDKQDLSHYTYFTYKPNAVEEIGRRTIAFSRDVETELKKFIYLLPPDKYIKGYTELPRGIPYNYANEVADNFIDKLEENNITTMDLRKGLDKCGIPEDKIFFKTDHHWTIPTVFWEFGQIIERLNKEYGLTLDEDGFYRNENNYNIINYKKVFAGSMARKAGIYYTGIDDFTLIYPKYKTNYEFYARTEEQEIRLEGRFEDALVSVYPLRVKTNTYALDEDKYSAYLFGNHGIVHMINREVPHGPKFLFIKDSFAVPLAAFLSTISSEVYLIDPRFYNEDILDFAKEAKVDFVFMCFYPQDLTEDFFPFYDGK